MRIFALSDVHVDFEVNRQWVTALSTWDYRDDVLILAGDLTDDLTLLDQCISALAARFKSVLYVPGNHELWARGGRAWNSLEKFSEVMSVARSSGAITKPFRHQRTVVIPLLSWYDYSFGEPTAELKDVWMDFHVCRWPEGFTMDQVAAHFAALNDEMQVETLSDDKVITFSHFMPRFDVLPQNARMSRTLLLPVLGTDRLEQQLRRLNSTVHVYGHSHVNRRMEIDGVTYINNALGYPHEPWATARSLLSIHEA